MVAPRHRHARQQPRVDAVRARVHVEDGSIYAESGAAVEECGDRNLVRFRTLNVFFGGTQAVERDPRAMPARVPRPTTFPPPPGHRRPARRGRPRRGGVVVVA